MINGGRSFQKLSHLGGGGGGGGGKGGIDVLQEEGPSHFFITLHFNCIYCVYVWEVK